MIPDVAVGLAQCFGNFGERKPFKKTQAQRFALVLRQVSNDPS